eukprot:jgi/Psemu1/58057/gm1.58057_g
MNELSYVPQLACGGSIWDEDLNKWAAYRDLIRHPKAQIQELWLKSGEDEFGRLFQGFQQNNIEGMDVLDWIRRTDVPIHKRVTYPRYTLPIRPEKADPYRTRITAGGDQLEYHGNVSTRTASMETIKTHWNSVVSSPGAKYCTGDISNMYLCFTLDEPEYIKFRWDMIPPRVRIAYQLEGLKQGEYSGKIAHDDLVDHLQKYGYKKAPHTEGLFLHDERDINFTLVVDDFGIKYTRQEDVDHLVAAVGAKYTFKVDWSGKQYVGVHLRWDYDKREVRLSMNGYVEQALKEFEHVQLTHTFAGPSRADVPAYGKKIQYAKLEDVTTLSDEEIKFIQQVTGKFLFYARAVDNTMLHALNDIASAKNNKTTLAATKYFLNYASWQVT